MNAIDFLLDAFEAVGDKTAVVASSEACSFDGLGSRVRQMARELDLMGISAGAVVGLEGDFSPGSIALFLALVARRAVIVPGRADGRPGRERVDEVAQVEARFYVDGTARRFERTGRVAAHPLYDELRRRHHPGLVQFTSATSGEPKAAVHDMAHLLEKFRMRRPGRSTIAFLHFDHLGGLNTMLHTLSNGATLVCPPDRSPATVCGLVERHRVELLAATPTFFNLLLLSGAHREHDMASLRVLSYGAEPMLQATLDRLRSEFPTGVRIQQTYGMVEVGALRTKSRDDGSLWVKVGGEGVETRVVDGVLQIRSRSMVLGYLNAPLAVTGDGWLVTGDAVAQDGEYLRFVGRDSAVINVGGEKVHPTEVEDVLLRLDGVDAATVRGEPNQLMGQVVTAELRTAEAVDPVAFAKRVKRHCRERLERYKVPVRVSVTDEPLSLGDRLKRAR